MLDPAQERAEFFASIDCEQHFFRLFDHLEGISFFAKDVDGRLIFVDRSLLDLYDFDEDVDIVGTTDWEVLPRSLVEKFRRDDLEVMATKRPLLNMIELFLSPQGIPGWFMTNKLPILSRSGEVLGVMGTIQAYGDIHLLQQVKPQVRRALEHIESNYHTTVSIARLAEIAEMSVRQFERVFKRHFNTTPQQYVIKRRIYDACERLRGTQQLADVAIDLGFYDQSSFTRQFRKHMGITPLQYRKRYG